MIVTFLSVRSVALTGVLNKGIINKFEKDEILMRLENYISGWKNYYKSTCEKHFLVVREKINNELKKHYNKFPEIINATNKKYYL